MIVEYLLLVGLVLGECRGPHHPRGEPIARHVHYRPTKEKITQDAELLHDREHLQEHLEEVIDEPDLSKMTDEELEFYYFQVHDTDKNSKLDGLEILQAILHTTHDHDQTEEEQEVQKTGENEEDFHYYIEIIDRVLKEDDLDNDGYLSYPEYASVRKKALIAEGKKQPSVKMVA